MLHSSTRARALSGVVLALTLVTSLPTLLRAQRAVPDSAAQDSTRKARALNPVVTTATRDQRELRKLPVSITVIDTNTLGRTSTVSLTEALRTVPGVIAGNLFGGDDVRLSIRGSGARGGFGVRGVGLLLDGVPITEPDGQTRLDQLDLGAARSIEIVRGPGSAMYGGAASGGVVNVITRSGREMQGVSVRMTGGGFGFDSVNLRKVDVSAGGARGAFDGYLQASNTDLKGMRVQNKNDMQRANVRLNWTRQEDGRAAPAATATRIGLDASYSDLDMQIPGSLTDAGWRDEPWTADPLNVTGAYGRREQRWRFGARASQGLGTRFGSLDAFAFGTARTIQHPIFRFVDQNTHRVQGGVRHAIGFGSTDAVAVRLNTGLDVDRWYGDSRQWTNVAGTQGRATPCVNDRVANIVRTECTNQYVVLPSVGTYTSADVTHGKLTFTAGARYDKVTFDIDDRIRPNMSVKQSFDQVSPRAAVRYDVRPGVSVYSSVARGFEVPTNSELTASPDTIRGLNTELRPSSLVNYEVGAKALVASRVLFDAAIYRTNVTGEFLSRTVVIPGVQFPRTIYENVGRTRRTGLELSATTLVAPWMDVVTSYTYAHYVMTEFRGTEINAQGQSVTVDYAGKLIPGVPQHRAAAEVRLRPTTALNLTVWGEAQGATYVDNANTSRGTIYTQVTRTGAAPLIVPVPFSAVPGYALAHATISWRLPEVHGARTGTSRAELFLNVENLLDKRYAAALATNSGNGRFYYPGAGRSFNAGVTLSTGGR
ncbi:TonB-dependent receptor [Gemmatimonas aurantiaca]|uniref:TonB-dependent receptor family protein n=1 Tax=Gemmatimonas aurantiaca TaxID=173480 RepID=UPI00301CCA0A